MAGRIHGAVVAATLLIGITLLGKLELLSTRVTGEENPTPRTTATRR